MSLAPDPADKAFVDTFKTVTNRRAGYSADAFERLMRHARLGGTLQAGEGLQIIEHFEEILYREVMTRECKTPCGVPPEHCVCWNDVRKLSPA